MARRILNQSRVSDTSGDLQIDISVLMPSDREPSRRTDLDDQHVLCVENEDGDRFDIPLRDLGLKLMTKEDE